MKDFTKKINSKNMSNLPHAGWELSIFSRKVSGKEMQMFTVGRSWVRSSMETICVQWYGQGYWRHLLQHTKMINMSLHKTAILYFDKIILISFLECVFRNSKSHQAILYHSLRSQTPIFPSIFESHISSAHRNHVSESIVPFPHYFLQMAIIYPMYCI